MPGHLWDQCFRNPKNPKYLEKLAGERGKPNRRATQAHVAEVMKRYHRTGVPLGEEGRKVKIEKTTNAIRVNLHGQRDIVVHGYLNSTYETTIFVDTGSQVSIISKDHYEEHRQSLGPIGPMPNYNLLVADGAKARVLGTIKCPVTFRDKERKMRFTRDVTFIIMSGLSEPVLAGLNLLKLFFSVIDLSSGKLSYRVDLIPDAERDHTAAEPWSTRIRTTGRAIIPARTMRHIAICYDDPDFLANYNEDQPIIRDCETIYSADGELLDFGFANEFHHPNGGGAGTLTSIMLINRSNQPITFSTNTVIGRALVVADQPSDSRHCNLLRLSRPSRDLDGDHYHEFSHFGSSSLVDYATSAYRPLPSSSVLHLTQDRASMPILVSDSDFSENEKM